MINLVKTYLNDHSKTEVLIAMVWKNFRRFVLVLWMSLLQKKKVHMKRAYLCNRLLKNRSPANKTAYLKEFNYCVFILRKINLITKKI